MYGFDLFVGVSDRVWGYPLGTDKSKMLGESRPRSPLFFKNTLTVGILDPLLVRVSSPGPLYMGEK